MIGLDGPVTIRRARFQCGRTGKIICPLDEALDLPDGGVTVGLARRSLRLSLKLSFEELQEELVEQHDVRLTDSTLDELMNKVGAVAEADRQEALEELVAAQRGVEREQKVEVKRAAPKRLYVSCDGIFYRTRYREPDPENPGKTKLVYQEMKCGAVFWQDARGHWCKQVVAGRDNPERFGLDLWRLAVTCGMLQCPEVIFISDGGIWCESIARLYFKDAIRILDWYHLTEHIWSAGRELYPGNKKQLSIWVDQCIEHLHQRSGIGLLLHLERCRKARGEEDQVTLDKLIGYLRPRLEMTEYTTYRAAGYVIGSGMMESTCKQVVQRRLKGNGMQWHEQGALAMSNLVAHRINGTWNDFWDTRPLQRVA